MEINGKTAVITGGIRGIGFVTVKHLLQKKAKHVAILDLPKSSDNNVVKNLKELEKEFGRKSFEYYECDVTKKDVFAGIYKKVSETQGYVDILINNAGIGRDKLTDLLIDVNLKAVVNCTLIALDHMGKHKGGKGGAIVNIGSYLGLEFSPMAPIYNATKHAVVAFSRCMKLHYDDLGVRVLCVCPGLTDTMMVIPEDLRGGLLDFIGKKFEDSPLDKTYLQKPDNVASAVVKIIESGPSGSVWLAQNDEPPLDIPEYANIPSLVIVKKKK